MLGKQEMDRELEDGRPAWPDHTPRKRCSFSVAAFCQDTSVDLEGSRIMGGRRLSLCACLDSWTGDTWTPRWEKPPELAAWPDSCSSSTVTGQRPPPWVGKGGSGSSPLAGRDSLERELKSKGCTALSMVVGICLGSWGQPAREGDSSVWFGRPRMGGASSNLMG